MSPDLDALADLLQTVHQRLSGYIRAYVQQTKIPLSTVLVMARTAASPGTTLSGIARQTGFAKSHVKAIVDELHAQGLMRKATDAADQRLQPLYLTEAGQARYQAIRQDVRRQLARLLAGLDAGPAAHLHQGLQALEAALAAPPSEAP